MDELLETLKNLKKSPNRRYTKKIIDAKTSLVNGLIESIRLNDNKAEFATALKMKEINFNYIKHNDGL